MNDQPPMTDNVSGEQKVHWRLGEEVARIEGTRPCLQCGHDLFGQPIHKLEPYSILLTRCPECGTAAPLNEYPVLGRWGRRLGIAAAATCIFSTLIFFLIQVLVYFGFISIMTFEGLRPTGRALVDIARKHQPGFDQNQWQSIDMEWARAADPVLINEAFRFSDIMFSQLIPLTFMLLLAFIFGVIWSGLLLGTKKIWVMAAPVVTVLIGGAISSLTLLQTNFSPMKLSGTDAAIALFGSQVLLFFMLSCLALTLTGSFLGRSILRFLASFVLPPRQRVFLAPLWTCDGKNPPSRKPWDRR